MATTDMAASLAFYRKLGLDIPQGAEREPHVETVLPGGLRMAWDSAESISSFDPDWKPGHGGGLSPAFRCGSAAEVDELYAELTAAGHPGHREPWDAPWGQRYAVLLDPDGNTVDLFAQLTSGAAG